MWCYDQLGWVEVDNPMLGSRVVRDHKVSLVGRVHHPECPVAAAGNNPENYYTPEAGVSSEASQLRGANLCEKGWCGEESRRT